jgi:hypothetical protein
MLSLAVILMVGKKQKQHAFEREWIARDSSICSLGDSKPMPQTILQERFQGLLFIRNAKRSRHRTAVGTWWQLWCPGSETSPNTTRQRVLKTPSWKFPTKVGLEVHSKNETLIQTKYHQIKK